MQKYIKQVEKPWGKELWIELNNNYCLKELHINAGQRTSLQYHEVKYETMFVLEGSCLIEVEDEKVEFKERQFITLPAGRVHRIEAIEDTVIIEASTPEVEDVVRLEDDYDRTS